MKAFRDIRVMPVVLVAIFGFAVLKIAGLVLDGGYVFDYEPQSAKRSWAQDTFNFPTGKGDPADITGSVEKPKEEPPKPAAPEAEPATLIRRVTLDLTGLPPSVAEIEAASKVFPVATVQNRYNFIDRNSEAALDYCEKHEIGFIPWAPLDAGASAKPGSALDAIAHKHKASPGQIALAWLLKRSPVMLPIPGTGKVAHLEENVGAAAIKLTDEEFAELDRVGRAKA